MKAVRRILTTLPGTRGSPNLRLVQGNANFRMEYLDKVHLRGASFTRRSCPLANGSDFRRSIQDFVSHIDCGTLHKLVNPIVRDKSSDLHSRFEGSLHSSRFTASHIKSQYHNITEAKPIKPFKEIFICCIWTVVSVCHHIRQT